jgi:tetratricopeptide (TPR) repeat protein
VPFFLEELVHSLRETGAVENREGSWALKGSPGSVPVPATVHDVLTARIDRLPEGAKRVLQVAALLGREFSWELVEAVAERPEQELVAHIEALTDAELVYERGVPPDATYLFKHALTQDVAYQSLLQTARNELHQKVAEAILDRHGDDLDEWAGPLGHHFANSERPEQALPYLVKIGERAARVYANAEAIASFSQALEILDALPVAEATRRQRASLTVQLGSLHALLGHYGESQALFERALSEAHAAGDLKTVARLETRIGRVRYSIGDHEGAIACHERALELAKRLHDSTRMAVCFQSLGDVNLTLGNLAKAVECFTEALRIGEEADNPAGVAAACAFLSNAHHFCGNLAEAVRFGDRALALGEQLDDDRRITWACIFLTQAHGFAGEWAEASALAERAEDLCKKRGDFRGTAWVKWLWGLLAFLDRKYEKAVEYMQHMIQMGQESGGFQHEVGATLTHSADALVRLGRYQEAFEYCQQSLAISLKTASKVEQGRAYKVLAEIRASEPYRDWGKAEGYLQESLKLLHEAGGKIFEGETHLSGARIARLRNDGSARRWADTARDIFARCGAKPYLKEAEELLAVLK